MNIIAWIFEFFGVFIGSIILILILWFLVSYTPLRDKMSEKYNGNT